MIPPKITDDNISQIFGNEAAENESIDRLKQYYVKGPIYRQCCSKDPLRIIVGHKGIGKSALVKIAINEDHENGILTVLVRPDDIIDIARGNKNFLELIRDWKQGLLEIIAQKAFDAIGLKDGEELSKGAKKVTNFLDFLNRTISHGDIDLSMEEAKKLLADKKLKSSEVHVYIDDLDRGWEGRKEDIHRISALLNAVRDLSSDNIGLRFKISLRSDVFFLVRTSDESTDKIEGSVVWFSWTNHEILLVLIKRIESYLGRVFDESRYMDVPQSDLAPKLEPFFESRFQGKGHWQNAPMFTVLMSLVRKRPRDLVKLCTLAAKHSVACGNEKIMTSDLEAIFEDYSQGRIQDTINEYKSELPNIKRLLFNMKPNKRTTSTRASYSFNTADLLKKIDNIRQNHKFEFSDGKIADKKALAAFLYKINFLCARKEEGSRIRWRYFEEQRYLASEFVDFGYDWEIHPAYRWALQPDTLNTLFDSIEIDRMEF